MLDHLHLTLGHVALHCDNLIVSLGMCKPYLPISFISRGQVVLVRLSLFGLELCYGSAKARLHVSPTRPVDLQIGSHSRRLTFTPLGNSLVNLGKIPKAEQQLFLMTSEPICAIVCGETLVPANVII